MKLIFALGVLGILMTSSLPVSGIAFAEKIRMIWVLAWMLLFIGLLVRKALRRRECHLRSDPIFFTLLLFLVSALVSAATSVNIHEAMHPLILIAAAAAVYWCLIQGQVTSSAAIDLLPPGISVAAIVDSLSSNPTPAGQPSVAVLLMPSLVASLLAIRDRRMILFPFAAISLVSLELARAPSAVVHASLIGGGVVLGATIWTRRRLFADSRVALAMRAVLAILAVATLLIVSGGAPSADDWSMRRDQWNRAARLAKSEPLLGVGPGNFAVRVPPHNGPAPAASDDAGNSYLQIFAEQGVPGLILLFFLIYAVSRRFVSYARGADHPGLLLMTTGLFASVAAALLSGFFHAHTTSVAHLSAIIVMIALVECSGNLHMRFSRRPAGETFLSIMIAIVAVGLFFVYITGRDAAADYRRGLGVEALERGELQEAIQHLETASDWRFNDWRTQWRLGAAYFKGGRFVDARARLECSLRLHPYNSDAHLLMGEIHERENDPVRAESSFRKAMQSDPSNSRAPWRLGILKAAAGDLPAAREAFQKAITIDPTFADAYRQMGEIYRREGNEIQSRLWHERADRGARQGCIPQK